LAAIIVIDDDVLLWLLLAQLLMAIVGPAVIGNYCYWLLMAAVIWLLL
jgi:hypothetical protein